MSIRPDSVDIGAYVRLTWVSNSPIWFPDHMAVRANYRPTEPLIGRVISDTHSGRYIDLLFGGGYKTFGFGLENIEVIPPTNLSDLDRCGDWVDGKVPCPTATLGEMLKYGNP